MLWRNVKIFDVRRRASSNLPFLILIRDKSIMFSKNRELLKMKKISFVKFFKDEHFIKIFSMLSDLFIRNKKFERLLYELSMRSFRVRSKIFMTY